MSRLRALAFLCAFALPASACKDRKTDDAPLLVFAAASLTDVLTELGPTFEAKEQKRVEFSFASSRLLAEQIKASPAADVFISADEASMDLLSSAQKIVASTRRDLLSNRLVVIAHKDSSVSISKVEELVSGNYENLILADPESVPAGKYAKEALTKSSTAGRSIWDGVKDRVIGALDVRAALAIVENRKTVVGIVYRTDAMVSNKVRVLFAIPPEISPEIRYPAAVIQKERIDPKAAAFVSFLGGEEARKVFEKHGFLEPQ